MSDVYLGVDYRFREIALGMVISNGGWSPVSAITRTVPKKLPDDQTLMLLKLALIDAYRELVPRNNGPVKLAIVEEPGGKGRRKLTMAMGVILCGFGELKVSASTYPVSSWRLQVLGKGNASKEDALAFARKSGYAGASLDEAEAICLAVCAQQTATFSAATPPAKSAKGRSTTAGRSKAGVQGTKRSGSNASVAPALPSPPNATAKKRA